MLLATLLGLSLLAVDTTRAPLAAGPRFPAAMPVPAIAVAMPAAAADTPVVVFELSEGYGTRLTIHRYASWATLPLFAAQYVSGDRKLEGEGGALAGAHGGLAAAVAGLFAVNTVTGAWNLWETRSQPEGRTLRTIHGVLNLVADAGFVATGVAANSSRETHRDIAVASMAVAGVGYLIMLPGMLGGG